MRENWVRFAPILGVLFAPLPAFASTRYFNATDVFTFSGVDRDAAAAMNAGGVVVGTALVAAPFQLHAFTYDTTNHVLTDLGPMPSGARGVGTSTRGFAINAGGDVVGYGYQDLDELPFVNSHGTTVVLNPFGASGNHSDRAFGINAGGTVVGRARYDYTGQYQPFPFHAFVYKNGTSTDLGDFGGGYSAAYAVNDSGVIVGEAETTTGHVHAFRFANGTMADLGVLPGGSYIESTAVAINSSGDIVGGSGFADATNTLRNHAFYYHNGVMTDLGLPTLTSGTAVESIAEGMTDSGQIWGTYHDNLGRGNAFLGTSAGIDQVFVNGWPLVRIIGITDSGDIYAEAGVNDWHILKLTPTAVPEPSALGLAAFAAVVCVRRRHQATGSNRVVGLTALPACPPR